MSSMKERAKILKRIKVQFNEEFVIELRSGRNKVGEFNARLTEYTINNLGNNNATVTIQKIF